MSTPRVSISITNFNYAGFLPEAIESALAQDYPDCEVLVLDDASTDNSLEVACRYPVTVLAQRNGGLCLARNNALTMARGRYVLFLDADDRLTPRAVSLLVAALDAAGEDVGYAYGQMKYFGLRDDLFPARPFDARQLFRNNYVCATTLLRREVLLKAGGYDNGFRSLREDWELYIRLLSLGYHGAFVPEVILECRKHKPHIRRSLGVKALSMAKLCWLYPAYFWKQWLKHPLRYTYFFIAAKGWQSVRDYGDKAEPLGLRVVRRAEG